MEYKLIKMETDMKGSGKMIKKMVRAQNNMKMVIRNMKESGKMANEMDRVYNNMKMVIKNMKVAI